MDYNVNDTKFLCSYIETSLSFLVDICFNFSRISESAILSSELYSIISEIKSNAKWSLHSSVEENKSNVLVT